MNSFYAKQPYKTLYLSYVLVSLLLYRLPLFLVLSLPPFRPRTSWSFTKAFQLRLVRWALTSLTPKVGRLRKVNDHLAMPTDLKPNVKGVWLDPVGDEMIIGHLKDFVTRSKVEATYIPGYWYQRKGDPIAEIQQAAQDEWVILNFHGGAYMAQSAHPEDPTQNIPRGVLEHVPRVRRLLSVEYSLSKGEPHIPQNPFPAALLDALSAYKYLVHTMHFQRIVLMGDSAGANLALALTRYLVSETIPGLTPPAALILHSPWVDLGPSHVGPNSSLGRFANCDYLGNINTEEPGYAIKAFTHSLPPSERVLEPYISPASKLLPEEVTRSLFVNFPRTFIDAGGAEQILDEIHTLRDRMKAQMGDRVQYIELDDAFHDFIVFPWAEPERTKALKSLSQWFTNL